MASIGYTVIEFCESNLVDIIPTNWCISDEEDFCLWPSKKLSSKAQKMAKDRAAPDAKWDEYKIRILGKAGK